MKIRGNPNKRNPNTFSIRLMPDRKCKKTKSELITRISDNLGGPLFKPHVTLIGGLHGKEIDLVNTAKSLSNFGVNTTLISGPTNILKPANVKLVKVKSAEEMLIKTKEMLPVDIAVCAAAVCDFKIKNYTDKKIKSDKLSFAFEKNYDILIFISTHNSLRP